MTDDITLKQLRYFLSIEETRHFRRAAEINGISQPSLTIQIQNLEQALGIKIVERGRSGVALTPVGREVAHRARTICDEVQSLADYSAEAQHGLSGTIRLGAKPTLGPYLLPHVVARLHKKHADLNLYVRESSPRDLESELIRGVHDVILIQLPTVSSELVTGRLFREPLYLTVASDHPLASEDTVSPAQLKSLPMLSLSPDFHLHDQVHRICEDMGATLMRDYEGTSLDALRTMVGMGMGAAFLPALYVHSEITARSEVVVKKIRGRQITRSVGLVWRKSAGRASGYQMLADLIREVVSKKMKDIILES